MSRFIYFDLGNVLLTFDHLLSCRRIASRSGLTEDVVWQVIFESGLQLRYEVGELTSNQFVDAFQAAAGCEVDGPQFLSDCSDIFELNAPIVPVVANLRAAGYRLGILSNTCEAHWDFVSQGRYTILKEMFDVVVLSYEHQALKPMPSIYEVAVAASACEPGEIFFTDDRQENVDGALRLGLDATLFRGVQSLISDLRARGFTINL